MTDSFEDSHDHVVKKKKIFFAPPVVGFFRENLPYDRRQQQQHPVPQQHQPQQQQQQQQQQHRYSTPVSAPAPALRDSVRASRKNVTFQVDCVDSPSDSDGSDDEDEEYGSISLLAEARRSGSSYGSISSLSTAGGKRTGKELWAIVRRHVFHSEFHIRDTVRQAAIFQSVGPGAKKQDNVRFRDIDLPYDFTLWDCFFALLAYLAISVIAYSFVFEKWSVIDSMYFAVVTFTTIGYGDFSPSTTGGRLFCVLFALGGVAVLAIALGVVGHKIIESQVASLSGAETKFVDDWAKAFKKDLTRSQRQRAYAKKDSAGSGSFSYLDEYDQVGFSIRQRAKAIKSPWHNVIDFWKKFGGMLSLYIPALTPLFLGAYLIGHYEGWTWTDVIYYCVVTTTSIGYGDLTPSREDMRLFAVLYIPLGVAGMGHFVRTKPKGVCFWRHGAWDVNSLLTQNWMRSITGQLGTIATFIIERRTQKTNEVLWKHELTIDDLRSMSSSGGSVTEMDFLIFMLKAMKKVDDDLIAAIRGHFEKLDLTQSGTLVRRDLELRAKQQLRTVKNKLRLGAYKAELLRKSMSSSDDV